MKRKSKPFQLFSYDYHTTCSCLTIVCTVDPRICILKEGETYHETNTRGLSLFDGHRCSFLGES
jgi:hypothetical protein